MPPEESQEPNPLPSRGGTPLQFGKYQLLRLLARGGMGEVYLARLQGELGFEKRLVIKTILPELAEKPHFIELFAAEAKTAVALSHGNIVPIYELGRTDRTFYIVMGHVDGPSVAQLLAAYRRRGREPDLAVALQVARGVLSGLAYAHTAEPDRPAVVHRDVSPRNILLDRSGQVRIVDFGIALPAQVQINVRAGSSGYVAPEQARAAAADPRADVFSSAAVLYELCTLSRAFPREGVWTMPDLEPLPSDLRSIIGDALSVHPEDRPADATELLARLTPLLAVHAPAMSDQALAASLREMFPRGFDRATEPVPAGELAAVDGTTRSETFATRLTALTGMQAAPRVPAGGLADERPIAEAVASAARRTWRHALRPRHLAFVAAVLATGAAGLAIARLGDAPRPLAARTTTFVPRSPALDWRTAAGEPWVMGTPRTEPAARVHSLRVDPPDARVSLDGVALAGPGPYALTSPGHPVEVRVEKPGYVAASFQFPSSGGELPPRHLALERAKLPGSGFIEVSVAEVSWAEVYVDGRRVGTTPLRSHKVSAGRHDLEIRCVPDACASDRVLMRKRVEVRGGEVTSVRG